MDKEAIKNLIRCLEEASMEEIENHRQYILQRVKMVSTREGKADVRLALRLIDEEVLSRLKTMKSGQD